MNYDTNPDDAILTTAFLQGRCWGDMESKNDDATTQIKNKQSLCY